MHTHRNFGNFKSDLKEVRNFLKISVRVGSKFSVSAVQCSPPNTHTHIRLGMRAVSLGARGKRNNWNFISPLQMLGTKWKSRGGRAYVPRLQQSSQTCVNHPACSEPHAWRSQRHAGKWEEVETCYPRAQSNVLTTGKKNKNKHTQK